MYNLVQYLPDYINLEEIQSLIKIKFRTTYNGLNKLDFKNKNIKKNVFIDRYEWPNMVENCKKFLSIIKNLKLYLVEFKEDGSMKIKNYPDDCIVREDKPYLIIVTTYKKCTFFANNKIWKA